MQAQALRNVKTDVEAAGGTLSNIVALRIYVVHLVQNVEAVGGALPEMFTTNPPTSTWIGVSSLAVPEFLIEVEATGIGMSVAGIGNQLIMSPNWFEERKRKMRK